MCSVYSSHIQKWHESNIPHDVIFVTVQREIFQGNFNFAIWLMANLQILNSAYYHIDLFEPVRDSLYEQISILKICYKMDLTNLSQVTKLNLFSSCRVDCLSLLY